MGAGDDELLGWGRSMALYLGGLQSIPGELYEAAAMDGAGSFRQFFTITLPLLSPTIFFNLVLSVIATFQILHQRLCGHQWRPA